MNQSNLHKIYKNINKLKEQGITFELSYIIEYTRDKKVLEQIESESNFDNIQSRKVNNLNEAVNGFADLLHNEYTLYAQLNLELSINGLIVLEDTLIEINKDNDIKKYTKQIDMLQQELESNQELQTAFLKKYKVIDTFKTFEKIYNQIK